MPARYDRTTGNYRITCRDCDAVAIAANDWDAEAADLNSPSGALVAATFRFHSTRGAWLNRCRACERVRNHQARLARGPRVPRTTTGAALGIARPFGVEFECGLPSHIDRPTLRAALAAAGVTGWTIKGDGSINIAGYQGVEIVSPPLRGTDGEEQVRKVAAVLRNLNAKVNRTCGTHVHHDANDLTVDQIKRAARSWFNNQPLIDGLVSESRRGPTSSFYCRPLTDDDIRRIENIRDLAAMRGVTVDRYRTMNLTSYGRHGTIEIRQHQGTLDAEKVISWVRFGQAIIDTAKSQATPVATRTTIREFFADLADNLNETARTFLIGRAVEFNQVQV